MTSGDKQSVENQYPQDETTLPKTDIEGTIGRTRGVHYPALQMDDCCRALNSATSRYEGTGNSETYQQQIVREILRCLAEIRKHADEIDDLVSAEKLSGELGVGHVLAEGKT